MSRNCSCGKKSYNKRFKKCGYANELRCIGHPRYSDFVYTRSWQFYELEYFDLFELHEARGIGEYR